MIPAVFAGIAQVVSAAFGGPFYSATLYRRGTVVLDDGGSIVPTPAPAAAACTAQVDVATEAMRSAEGFSDKDVRILVLAGTLVGAIDTDAEIAVSDGPGTGRYSIQSVGSDLAGLGWELRGRPA